MNFTQTSLYEPCCILEGDTAGADVTGDDIEEVIEEDIEVLSDKIDEDDFVYSDDFEDDESGDESDIEDNDLNNVVYHRERDPNPQLPETVTVLDTDWGSKVYLVGTAHFSEESQRDVSQVWHTIITIIR